MSRYLTPSKLCLLILVQLYRHEPVPKKSTIPILSFISCHITRRSMDQSTLQDGPSPASLQDFEHLLSSQESAHPGRSLFDVFVRYLWSIHNLVSFTDFLADLTAITQPPPPEDAGNNTANKFICSPTSPIGQFTRRCQLESVRLQFSDAYQLWENFVLFREPTKSLYLLRNPDSEYARDCPNAAAADLLHPDQPTASAVLMERLAKRQHGSVTLSSLDDVEKAMHFQLSKLQKYGARVPAEMKAHLAQMTTQGGTSPSEMHFIK